MTSNNNRLPLVPIENIVFDSHGSYQIEELSEQELLNVAGGSGVNQFFCPGPGSNVIYCPVNSQCNPVPQPPPPPTTGEEADAM